MRILSKALEEEMVAACCANPLWDFAQQLVDAKFTEAEAYNAMLRHPNLVSGVFVNKVRNYMRDINNGRKKPVLY